MSFEDDRRRNHRIIIGLAVGFVAIVTILFMSIIYSSSDERLDEAVELCNSNEDSESCQQFLKRYDITFAYCNMVGDQMGTKEYTLNGQTFDFPTGYPEYGVAWFGNSDTPPNQTISDGEHTMALPSLYIGCEVQNKF